MQLDQYQQFTAQLIQNLQADEHVVGLVLLGSTASENRLPDQWSDHDFFVITPAGVQEQFRTSTSWLPDSDSIAISLRETAHGLKILYTSGHLLEFAVFDLDEIALAQVNIYKVVFDKGGVQAALAAIASDEPIAALPEEQLQHHVDMFLCLLVVGAGRVARGEVISGQVFIRTYALEHLLKVLRQVLEPSADAKLDNLDVYRRFEQVFPEVGNAIADALSNKPIATALALLDICENTIGETEYFSQAGAKAVRDLLRSAQK